ncbi:MAG: hypothetical protein AAGH89_08170 [Verrucomicrobiota bacterium]
MNPFVIGRVVRASSYCPRPNLEKQLQDHLLAGQAVYVDGPRRHGKTSLISHVAGKSFPKRSIKVDFLPYKTAQEAEAALIESWANEQGLQKGHFQKILEILSQLGVRYAVAGLQVELARETTAQGKLSLSRFFQEADSWAAKTKKPHLFFFDEFQAVQDFDQQNKSEFIKHLRTAIQDRPHLRFVFAGSVQHQMHEIFQLPQSPLFQFAERIVVRGIEPPERFHRFLANRFEEGDRKVQSSFWDAVSDIVANHPQNTQRLCAAVWNTTSKGDSITDNQIETAIEWIFQMEIDNYQSIVAQSTALQLKVLKGLASEDDPHPTSQQFLEKIQHRNASSVRTALKRFASEGWIRWEKGHPILFINPFFKEWLRRLS